MNPRIRLLPIVLLVGLTGVVTASCRSKPDLSEEDRLARVDDEGRDKNDVPQELELFPDTEVGRRLREHMIVLALPAEMPEDADRRYAASLAELRQYPDEVVNLLASAYRGIDPARYWDRWSMVKTLADLELPAAYETLVSIARAPLPPEQNEDVHHFSTQEEEIMIRLRAVDGLASLAAQGHEAAEKDLLSLAVEPEYPNLAIQTRAIKGYLRAGADYEARAKLLRSRLPKELHGVVTLETTPREEFDSRVRGLATIADGDTTLDRAEETLPDAEAPAARPVEGDEKDED